MRVLVVEDSRTLADALVDGLQDEAMAVDVAYEGLEAAAKLDLHAYDVVVLDRDLPGIHGDTLCRMITERENSAMVLMLTASGSPAERVSGLSLGADDYLSKPFSVRELVARVAAVWRRTRVAAEDPSRYEDSDLTIDEKSFRVFRYGQEVKLAKKEFELLWLLIRNRGAVISRDRILSEIWHMSDEVETRTVDAHVRNLRKKIGSERITTVVGFGYRYDPPKPA